MHLRIQSLVTSFLLAAAFFQARGGELRAKFEALDDQQDRAGMVELWRANPAEALGVIDSYLEGSLGELEQNPKADPAALAAMEARALRGARAADEAFGTAIFADYAASFGGWSREEQTRFRQGQARFGEASKALRAKQFDAALAKAGESLDLARPLGDWWGSAMALGAQASAHLELGQAEKALECASQARAIDHDLRLSKAELGELHTLVRAAQSLGRLERARVAAEDGLALARALKDEPRAKTFEAALAELQAKPAK